MSLYHVSDRDSVFLHVSVGHTKNAQLRAHYVAKTDANRHWKFLGRPSTILMQDKNHLVGPRLK